MSVQNDVRRAESIDVLFYYIILLKIHRTSHLNNHDGVGRIEGCVIIIT